MQEQWNSKAGTQNVAAVTSCSDIFPTEALAIRGMSRRPPLSELFSTRLSWLSPVQCSAPYTPRSFHITRVAGEAHRNGGHGYFSCPPFTTVTDPLGSRERILYGCTKTFNPPWVKSPFPVLSASIKHLIWEKEVLSPLNAAPQCPTGNSQVRLLRRPAVIKAWIRPSWDHLEILTCVLAWWDIAFIQSSLLGNNKQCRHHRVEGGSLRTDQRCTLAEVKCGELNGWCLWSLDALK